MSDLNFALDVTKTSFTVTITGEMEDIGALETDVFQPAVADQLVSAVAAKAKALRGDDE